jgi:hypothetical protein
MCQCTKSALLLDHMIVCKIQVQAGKTRRAARAEWLHIHWHISSDHDDHTAATAPACSTLRRALRRLPHTACLPPPPRGLTKLIHQRRKLLEYMRRSMFERYMALIQRLGLKDIYFKQVGACCRQPAPQGRRACTGSSTRCRACARNTQEHASAALAAVMLLSFLHHQAAGASASHMLLPRTAGAARHVQAGHAAGHPC